MSWPANAIISLSLILLLSAGCGFRPLYSEPEPASGMQGHSQSAAMQLQQVAVAAEDNRTGQLLRRATEDLLYLNGKSAARYRLTLTHELNKYPIGIEPDGQVSRYNLELMVRYQLSSASGTPIANQELKTVTSYNVVASDYATLIAERDATKRTTEEMAQILVPHLAKALEAAQ